MRILEAILFAAFMVAFTFLGAKYADALAKAECPREPPTVEDAYRSYPRAPR